MQSGSQIIIIGHGDYGDCVIGDQETCKENRWVTWE